MFDLSKRLDILQADFQASWEKLNLDQRLATLSELEKEVAELRKQVLNLTMNICMDLTCSNRIKEITKRNGKNKSRLDETTSPSRG